MQFDPLILTRGLVLFWSVWLSVVFVTNLFEGLIELGLLSEEWRFKSGNYAYVAKATATYSAPAWITAFLFWGVVAWEGVATFLYWRGLWAYRRGDPAALGSVNLAFGVSLALWAAFMVADEIFRTYRQQTSHILLFIGQIGTLLTITLIPG
jgi:hypothetical protein